MWLLFRLLNNHENPLKALKNLKSFSLTFLSSPETLSCLATLCRPPISERGEKLRVGETGCRKYPPLWGANIILLIISIGVFFAYGQWQRSCECYWCLLCRNYDAIKSDYHNLWTFQSADSRARMSFEGQPDWAGCSVNNGPPDGGCWRWPLISDSNWRGSWEMFMLLK